MVDKAFAKGDRLGFAACSYSHRPGHGCCMYVLCKSSRASSRRLLELSDKVVCLNWEAGTVSAKAGAPNANQATKLRPVEDKKGLTEKSSTG